MPHADHRAHPFAVRAALAATLLCTAAAVPAQSLNDLLRRGAEEARRAAEQAVRDAARPPPAPAPATAPAAQAASATAGILGLERRLADAPRSLDLRQGTPSELADRLLPKGAHIIVANPYVPIDRRFLMDATAMACHPKGGLVIYARSGRYEPETAASRGFGGREYADNGIGLWRVEADGKVRPLAVRVVGARFSQGERLCEATVGQVRLHGEQPLTGAVAVEASGDVLVADSEWSAIVRYRVDGTVEHVAGGGADVCTREPYSRAQRGWRDGPGRQALFAGRLTLAPNAQGEIFVAESSKTDSGAPGNCSLRKIGRDGQVSTIHGRGACDPYEVTSRTGYRIPGYDRVIADAQGRPLVLGWHRGLREGQDGAPDVGYSKVHRIEGGRDELLGRAGYFARFEPTGSLAAIGLAPDGTPLAYNDGSYSEGGFILVENKPRFTYWWRGAATRQAGGGFNPHLPPLDGPRALARITGVKDFCAGADGLMYVLAENAVRRIDPGSGEVTTWLH